MPETLTCIAQKTKPSVYTAQTLEYPRLFVSSLESLRHAQGSLDWLIETSTDPNRPINLMTDKRNRFAQFKMLVGVSWLSLRSIIKPEEHAVWYHRLP